MCADSVCAWGKTSATVSSVNSMSFSTAVVSSTFQRITGRATNRLPARSPQFEANMVMYETFKSSKRQVMAPPADWIPL